MAVVSSLQFLSNIMSVVPAVLHAGVLVDGTRAVCLLSLAFFFYYITIPFLTLCFICMRPWQGLVDGKRLCIAGGSAGGYTTLACLAFR